MILRRTSKSSARSPERKSIGENSYSYDFNGMEKDDEAKELAELEEYANSELIVDLNKKKEV